ncbi:response regulator [Methylocucumis oryzae]|uniref:LuxR family transcriptional regulator n=1 Tax=Methylocucumis oryzae TaxID=1632867 RepID=A0A0F3IFV0_9GAMM|nr:response regulator transcription factor [Methylocucumis oryzae]KJV05552.1 LuxR family transcriptional regulator [Methylocucumis oryzae]
MIRLLIVDDHELMREGLKQLFEGETDIEVCAEAASGEETLAQAKKYQPDLILLDLSIPGLHGCDLIRALQAQASSPPILILSMHNEAQIAKTHLQAGALGYITKDSSPKELLAAIRKVAAGGRYLSAELAEKIAFGENKPLPPKPHQLLSARELLILKLLATGHKVHEIGHQLNISSKTVSTHKARLMQKLNLDSEVKLFQYALEHGLTHHSSD